MFKTPGRVLSAGAYPSVGFGDADFAEDSGWLCPDACGLA
jgi:hypothetical protein